MTKSRARRQHQLQHPTRARLQKEVALYRHLGRVLTQEAKKSMTLQVRYYCGLISGTAPVDKQVYLNVVDQFFPGYTVFEANGRWAGASEPSIVIEVLTQEPESMAVAVGQALRAVGGQSAVLMALSYVNTMLITAV